MTYECAINRFLGSRCADSKQYRLGFRPGELLALAKATSLLSWLKMNAILR